MNFTRLAALFEEAAKLSLPEEVDAFLAGACGDDAEMRRQVQGLLDARHDAGDFLDAPVRMHPPGHPLEKVGDRIGPYHLLEKLGEGGCGVVYLAEQREPVRRRVALKVIKPGMDTQSIVRRFEAERQALARMEHPNVAKVFDAGVTPTGRPYFVMELVPGSSITEYCDAGSLSVPDRLRLVVKVCHAIQHAHQKGVIHRDIKPANILVTVLDGTPEPKVIDFGIAKAVQGRLSDDSVFTLYGPLLGTPAYMSPEQATPDGADVDTRTDVYSLGVLLYELLTGSPPFETRVLVAMGLDRMLHTLRETDPAPPSARVHLGNSPIPRRPDTPRLRRPALPSDLDWIVMKCLEKDKARRYETVAGLALDLQRHLDDEPVLARPPSRLDRLRKAYRRHRTTSIAAAAILLALLAGLLASTWQAARASRAERAAHRDSLRALEERDRALAAQTHAERSSRQTRRLAYVANLNVAFHAWRDGNLSRVNELLTAQNPVEGDEDLRDFEWRYLWGQTRSDAIRHRRVGRTPAYAALFSHDGSRIFVTHLEDVCRVLDAESLETRATLSSNSLDLALSHDGRTLAVLSNNGFVEVFDAHSLERRGRISDLGQETDQIRLSPDGTLLAASEDLRIEIRETGNGSRIATIPVPRRTVSVGAFAVSTDWTRFLTTDDRFLYLWDRASGTLAARLPGHPGGTYAATFSPDGRWLATGGWKDRALRLWDMASHNLVTVFTNHDGWIGRMDFSPDSSTLASCSADQTIRLWDLRERRPKAVLRHPVDEVWMVAHSHDGTSLVSTDRSGGIALWSALPRSAEVTRLEGTFAAGAFAADSRSFTTVTTEGLVQVREETSLREIGRMQLPTEGASTVRIGPDASFLAAGWTNGTVHLHDLLGRRPARRLTHPGQRAVVDLVLSADATRLASVTTDDLAIWDLGTDALLYHRINPADPYWGLTPLALSPDGRRLAFGGKDLRLRLVELGTGAERSFDPDLWGIIRLGFSPDGRQLAAAGRDHRIKVWQGSDFGLLATLKSWRQSANGFAFHPGGRRLAVGSGEGGIPWIDLTTSQEVGYLPTEQTPQRLLFSPDGNTLAVQFADGFRFWRAPSWQETRTRESSRLEDGRNRSAEATGNGSGSDSMSAPAVSALPSPNLPTSLDTRGTLHGASAHDHD